MVKNYTSEAEEAAYEEALSEIKSGHLRKGLATKAMSDANGDKKIAKSLYVKYLAAAIARDNENSRRTEITENISRTARSITNSGINNISGWKDYIPKNLKRSLGSAAIALLITLIGRHALWGQSANQPIVVLALWIFILFFMMAAVISLSLSVIPALRRNPKSVWISTWVVLAVFIVGIISDR